LKKGSKVLSFCKYQLTKKGVSMDPVVLYYHVDEFCKIYEQEITEIFLPANREARRKGLMIPAEVITLRIMYHTSGYKTLKDFFLRNRVELISYFPRLVSYNRFVELCRDLAFPCLVFAKVCCTIKSDGISYVDSTKLEVSNIRRASSHKTFAGMATKGHTSMGWFFGFKLHLITNMFGYVIDFDITAGNVADNNASLIRKLTKKLTGKLFGDRGYLLNKNLFEELFSRGLTVITKIRSNMKPRLMAIEDKVALQKRGISETIIGVLKEGLNLEHSRHRNPYAFLVHIASTLIAYFFRPNKPTIVFADRMIQD
jgi:hypothetical protein